MPTTLDKLQRSLGYTFANASLLLTALTHRSKQKSANNERLEFLGDAVLSLIITTDLFHRYPAMQEGDLSRLRAALVKGETIAKIASALGVGECLQLSAGESRSGGHQRESILAGAFEALIGAIYSDSNFETVQARVLQWYAKHITDIKTLTDIKDAKTTLQEWLQARQMPLPTYHFTVTGDAHAQEFTVICEVEGLPNKTKGVSTSRRKAEQIAAKLFLNQLL